jgi:hypothetical protein
VNLLFAASQKKCGCYHVYDAKTRLPIANTVEELGLARAVVHLQKALGHQISKSKIQSIRDSCRRHLVRIPHAEPGSIQGLPATREDVRFFLGPN